MAEVFGIVTGSLSVVALFNNAVSCLEYIQLGRNFGRDYQLRLDVARLRLFRWGAAVEVHDNPVLAATEPSTEDVRVAKMVLGQILDLFGDAYSASAKYKLQGPAQELEVFDSSSNTNASIVNLRDAMRRLTPRQQGSASVRTKISWALYQGKAFGRLVEDILGLLDDLEKVFPVQERCQQLVAEEVKTIVDAAAVQALAEASEGIDEAVRAASSERLRNITASNSVKTTKAIDEAKVKVGNEYIGQAYPGMESISTSNRVDEIDARDKSRVHVGDSFNTASSWLS